MIRGEVPEKARQAYGMGCGGVDTIPTRRWGLIGAGRPIPATGDVPESIAHAIACGRSPTAGPMTRGRGG